jgi:hypothetical protein
LVLSSDEEKRIIQKANVQIDELTRQQAAESAVISSQERRRGFKVAGGHKVDRVLYWDRKREEVRVQAQLAIKEVQRRMAEATIQAQSSKDEAQRRTEQAAYQSFK